MRVAHTFPLVFVYMFRAVISLPQIVIPIVHSLQAAMLLFKLVFIVITTKAAIIQKVSETNTGSQHSQAAARLAWPSHAWVV